MSKKRLLIFPIVAIIVAVMGISVFAGSPSVGVDVRDKDGNDVTSEFVVKDGKKIDLSDVKGLQDGINKVNNKLKVKDFKYIVGYDVEPNSGNALNKGPYKVTFANNTVKSGYVGIVVHQLDDGSYEYRVFKGSGALAYISGVKSFSPFCLYVAKPSSSPQTGDYAPIYIAAIGFALLSGGVFFAIKAKKATK